MSSGGRTKATSTSLASSPAAGLVKSYSRSSRRTSGTSRSKARTIEGMSSSPAPIT